MRAWVNEEVDDGWGMDAGTGGRLLEEWVTAR